jgi:hypothetical protein
VIELGIKKTSLLGIDRHAKPQKPNNGDETLVRHASLIGQLTSVFDRAEFCQLVY